MPFFSQGLASALMKFISGSSCPFARTGTEKVGNPLQAHSFHSGVSHFCQPPILAISGVEIEIILLAEINQESPFMTVDIFGSEISMTCLIQPDSTGAENTSVLKQHGSCLACQNVNHISQSLSNLSCDPCMSSVLPASGLEQCRSRARSLRRQ